MVSTRHHPRPFPEPTTPSPRATSTASSSPTKASSQPEPAMNDSESKALTKPTTRSTARTPRPRKSVAASNTMSVSKYTHVIDPIIMVWMLVSLPLVLWDTGYVLLRPHTMPGGKFHSPIWVPYALYGTVDYIYGWPAYNSNNGFTSAQGSLNALETIMYVYYTALVVGFLGTNGNIEALKFWEKKHWNKGGKMVVQGDKMATGVVIAFASAVMTLSKTILYWLNEYFSGFDNIGHNSLVNLFWLWIVPNGLWLIFPTYMIYVLGKEMINAMNGHPKDE